MLYLFLFAHLVADFVLQPYWLVVRKRYWHGLAIHGGLVLVCMLALGLIDRAVLALWPAMLGITAVHVAADWWKVHRADRVLKPAIVPFLLDQGIHVATLIGMISLALPQRAIWAISTAHVDLVVYGAAYIVAGLAVPIGIMVWRDPSFAHAALAPTARLRSFVIGAAGISLVLFAGPFALPVGLAGLMVVMPRQQLQHPLDRAEGRLTVLFLAALCGAVVIALHG